MRAILNVGDFAEMANLALLASDKKNSMPSLSNLLVKANEDGSLEVQGTDNRTSIIGLCKTEVSEPGKVLLPAKKISSFLAMLPVDGTIRMGLLENNKLKICCNSSTLTFPILDAESFPEVGISNSDKSNSLSIPADVLSSIMGKVFSSSSKDETRMYICSVLFSYKNGRLETVATDGFRLSKTSYDVESSCSDFEALVSAKTIPMIIKLLSKLKRENVMVSIDATKITFAAPALALSTLLLNHKFPSYEQLIPSEGHHFKVSRQELTLIVKRANVVANQFTHDLLISFSNENNTHSLCVSAQFEKESMNEALSIVSQDGYEVQFGVNGKYLLDALRTFEDDDIDFMVSSETSPMLITSSCKGVDSEHLVLVMPQRV